MKRILQVIISIICISWVAVGAICFKTYSEYLCTNIIALVTTTIGWLAIFIPLLLGLYQTYKDYKKLISYFGIEDILRGLIMGGLLFSYLTLCAMNHKTTCEDASEVNSVDCQEQHLMYMRKELPYFLISIGVLATSITAYLIRKKTNDTNR